MRRRFPVTWLLGVAALVAVLAISDASGAYAPTQATATPASVSYLPLILQKLGPPPTPTNTATDTPTATVTLTSTPEPTPTATPLMPMFGVWKGITNAPDEEISFNVTGDRSRVCEISMYWDAPCGITGGFSPSVGECFPISSDGRFSRQYSSSIFGISFTHRIQGNFTSATTATGTFQYLQGSCVVDGTWSANLTNLPTPTPRVCPTIRLSNWTGAATFTVSADRSRVLNFTIETNYGGCAGTARYTIPELPIVDCTIRFRADLGNGTYAGSGTFVSATEMEGSHVFDSSACYSFGNWISRWSSGE